MQLYLMRHGQAALNPTSMHVSLTPRGRQDAELMGKFARDEALDFNNIWHSDKTRAKQTAQIVAKAVGRSACLTERPDLTPESDIHSVVQDLNAARKNNVGNILIVSHMPFLPRLSYDLLSNEQYPSALEFHTATMACFSPNDSNGWTLNWIRHVEELR